MSYDSVTLVDHKLRWIEKDVRGTRAGYSAMARQDHLPAQTTFPAGSTVDWAITMNQPCIDSTPELQIDFTVVIAGVTGADNDAVLAKAGGCVFGMHQFPCNRLFNTMSVSLNGGAQTSTLVSKELDIVANSLSRDELMAISKYCAPDVQYAYENESTANPLVHPLDSVSDMPTRHWRTAQVLAITPDAAASTLTFKLRVQERLCAQPFQWFAGANSASPFLGLKNMNVSGSLVGDLSQILAICALPGAAAFSSITVNRMALVVNQFTPHQSVSLPSKAYYPFYRVRSVTANGGSQVIAGGASHQFTVPNTGYNGIPKMLAIRCYETGRTLARPSRNYPITNLELTIDGAQRKFQSYSPYELYQVSKKNGYALSYQNFLGSFDITRTFSNGGGNGNVNCVMYVIPSDLDLPNYSQSNVAKSTTIECSVTCLNPTGANATILAELSVIEDQILCGDKGHYRAQDSFLTASDVAQGKTMFMHDEEPQYLGGSFWGWVKRAGKNIGKAAVKAGKFVVSNPITKPIAQFATKTLRNEIPGVRDVIGDNSALGKKIAAKGWGLTGQGLVDVGGASINVAGNKMSRAQLMAMLDE